MNNFDFDSSTDNGLDLDGDKDFVFNGKVQENEKVEEEHVNEDNVDEQQPVVEDTPQEEIIDESEIKDEVEKRTDNEIIEEYLKPNSRCILCTTPIWSLKLNKAFLDGQSYSEMIDAFSTKFEERTSRSLNKSLLCRHFQSHFDVRAAAIAEYNKRRRNSIDGNAAPISSSQRDIFKLATSKYLDELELFDVTTKEMIQKYQELEVLIEEKRAASKTFGIDELILKQAQLLNVLNKQAISKFKALSKVDLESKQGQFLTQLSFIGNKAVNGLTSYNKQQQQLVSPQETEGIYLTVVIRQILARLEDPLKKTFGVLEKDQKTLFYRELKKAMEGIQEGITADFENKIKTETQRLIENKNKVSHES